MAARVLLQRRVAPLTAAALVGSVAFFPGTAHAEAPNDRTYSRKPIYDDDFDVPPPAKPVTAAAAIPTSTPPSPSEEPIPAPSAVGPAAAAAAAASEPSPPPATTTTTVVRERPPTPTDRLAGQIRRARLFLYSQACTAEDAVNETMSRVFALEQSFTSTLASLAPARESGEKLMPGAIYVLVAGMAGSIVARNRGVLLRGATPLALGLGAAWTVLPVTMGNVGALVWEYEKKVPAVADAHLRAREGFDRAVYLSQAHAQMVESKIQDGVRSARETLEEWVRKGK